MNDDMSFFDDMDLEEVKVVIPKVAALKTHEKKAKEVIKDVPNNLETEQDNDDENNDDENNDDENYEDNDDENDENNENDDHNDDDNDEEVEEQDFFAELGINDSKKDKAKAKGKKKEVKAATPVEPEFTGPRPVIVYGQELFVIEDSKMTLDEIREKIVTEFKYPEFSKERTSMSFDKITGIIVPVIEFKKKG